MYKPLLCTAGVGWVLNTASWAGPCHCVWPYNVQATAALDISSSVCLAIKYQSPAPHTPLPFQSQSQGHNSFGWQYCVGHKKERKKITVLWVETFQLETEKVENRKRHLPGQPRRARRTYDWAKSVLLDKGVSQSYREKGGKKVLEKKMKHKERKNQQLSKSRGATRKEWKSVRRRS